MDKKQLLASKEEWNALGFRAGLEIHHQIATKKKLFCHCPAADTYYDDYHAEVLRHMRPTMSELGEYDGTALMEFKTKKEITYRLHRDAVCTYEMDDNPPFPINDEAVDIALTIALALQCKIVGELHIIRKQYLDGSIPTGFQRTAIIGVDGTLPLSNGKMVPVIQLGLEEDSCREVSDVGHRIIFAADRLGFPLIEVVTAPVLETPEEAAEAADRIAKLLRATGMVRRGIGRGRQDVNLSIEGGPRVEIKGVPRIPRIPYLLSYEGRRQKSLLNLRDELHKRGFKAGDRPGEGKTYTENGKKIKRPELTAAALTSDSIRVIKLPKAKDLIGWELAAGHTFADEFSGRVRVVACLDQMPNIFHTDGESGLLGADDTRLFEEFIGCEKDDVAVIVWGAEADTITAENEILDRWAEAIDGAIPHETRQALRNDTTDFERVLPGPDRMYPDTDSAPKELVDERIEEAQKHVPVLPWVREEKYRSWCLPEDMVKHLILHPMADTYEACVENGKINALRGAEIISSMALGLKRKDIDIDKLTSEQWTELLEAVGNNEIYREGIPELLEFWAANENLAFDDMIEKLGFVPADDKHIASAAKSAIEEALKLRPELPEVQPKIAMGIAMDALCGRANGETVRAIIDKEFEVN